MNSKELRNLHEAYKEVYQELTEEQVWEEVETWVNSLLEEGYDLSDYTWDHMYEMYVTEGDNYDKNRQRAAKRAAERNAARAAGKTGNVPGVGYVTPRKERETYRDAAGVERHTSGARMPKKDVKEDYNTFDAILEYLVAEGYADTNENALAIMVNMSEEWRQDIMEISQTTKIKAYAASRDVDADYAYGSKVHDQGDRIKKAIVKKHGEKAGEHAERAADAQNFGRGPRAKPRIEKNRTYRTTKAGSMHGQDQAKLKSDLIKRRNK